MKNRILLIIGFIMMVSFVEAKTVEITNSKWDYHNFSNQRAISFTERGVRFYVFQNGEIDFRRPFANTYYGSSDYFYRNGKRIKKSRRNVGKHYNHFNGMPIIFDRYGRVKRVGNVLINYNYRGKVSNIGSVFMQYRRNLLTRVGGLKILRNRFGDVRFVGRVKPYQSNYNTGYYSFYNNYFYDDFIYDYNDDFFYGDEFYSDFEQFEEDDDYIYYRSKSKVTQKNKSGKTVSKPKMIKRKKKK